MNDQRGLWLTRLLLQRGLGCICLIAFIVALNQFRPLLGERGLLPVPIFVKEVPFRSTPSLFYLFPRDWAFTVASWIGIVLSCLVITGIAERYSTWVSVAIWASIYLIYLSFVNVGQTFYGFGWESILLESCFFAMFLGSSRILPQAIPIWLFRWLLFRIMFGAGLIKMRGDPCWKDLTCLAYFNETQPMPNPLSWYLHWEPPWVGKAGVLFNHFAELIVPFFFFLPQPIAGIAGVITLLFQFTIIVSGNLSWLNWLTVVLAFSTIDAKFLHITSTAALNFRVPSPAFQWTNILLAAIVALMSVPVLINMVSARQIMNTSFNSFHLVGTYGAFGSITRPRYEVVVEGTSDPVITPATEWKAYEFKAKPTDLYRMPPQIAPYHLRLDWLMWFAAMSSYQQHPWFVNFVAKLLQGDRAVLSLLHSNPFPDNPPRVVRARLFEYHFTSPDEHRRTGAWWKRSYAGPYFPSISLSDPNFQRILRDQGWAP
jgi:Lipase maturation factor